MFSGRKMRVVKRYGHFVANGNVSSSRNDNNSFIAHINGTNLKFISVRVLFDIYDLTYFNVFNVFTRVNNFLYFKTDSEKFISKRLRLNINIYVIF